MNFAKLFHHEKLGQVLVTTESDDQPTLKIRINMEGMDIATKLHFNDDDEGWQRLEKAFIETTKARAIQLAEKVAFNFLELEEKS